MSTNELLDTLYDSTKSNLLDWANGITSDMYRLHLENGTDIIIQKELNISQMGWDIVIYLYNSSRELISSFRINDAPNRLEPISKEFKKGIELMGMINEYVNKKENRELDDIVNQIKAIKIANSAH